MVKHIHITVPDYVWRRTIEKFPHKNKSEFVSELLLLGAEAKEMEMLKKQADSSRQDMSP